MKNDTWYYLDPDNTKDVPKGLHCECCKRKLKETQSFEGFISISKHPNPDMPYFKKDAFGRSLIGAECFKRVQKEFGEFDYNGVEIF